MLQIPEILKQIFPFLIPVLIIQLGLMIYCLIDLLKREKTSGPKWLWVLLIVLGQFWGPILYLIIGRK